MSRRFRFAWGCFALGLTAATNAQSPIAEISPVTDEMLEHSSDADWLGWRRTPNLWGFSPLAEVNARNVRRLRLVWTRPLPEGVQEGALLVHDGVMFFPAPSDVTQAIDAVTGDLLWEYRRPQPPDAAERHAEQLRAESVDARCARERPIVSTFLRCPTDVGRQRARLHRRR